MYEKSFESLERRSSQKITHRSELASMNLIQVEGNMVHIPENIQLDFWGIVKGYCVDRVRDFLRSKGYKNFLINAGGDIYVSGKISKTESCVIGIDSPLLDGELLASFELQDYSCSTSGTYKRNWTRDEQKFHHIVTPQNGGNSWEIESITLLAPDCAMSDGLATACIAMGYEKAKIFLESYGIPACIFLKWGAKASLWNWHEYRLSYAQ